MSQGMNVCHMMGRLGADSVLRYTQDQVPVLSFRCACGERYRDKSGQWSERVEWVNGCYFGQRAVGLHEILKKRSLVQFTGSLRQQLYTNQAGEERLSVEIRCTDIVPIFERGGQQVSESKNEE